MSAIRSKMFKRSRTPLPGIFCPEMASLALL
jgi:hypothetical protein